jgi:hypothetical protein
MGWVGLCLLIYVVSIWEMASIYTPTFLKESPASLLNLLDNFA